MSEPDPARALELPALSGRRVRLRAFRDTDVSVVQAASADPLIPLITTVPTTDDEPAARAYLARQHDRAATGVGYSFAIADLADDRAVGQIGAWLRDADVGRIRLGYWIAPGERRRGYAADALVTVADWALAMPGIHRVDLVVEPWNEASWRTAEQAGFEREGVLRAWEVRDGVARDMAMYARVVPADRALTD